MLQHNYTDKINWRIIYANRTDHTKFHNKLFSVAALPEIMFCSELQLKSPGLTLLAILVNVWLDSNKKSDT